METIDYLQLKSLQSRVLTGDEFNFDSMVANPICYYLSNADIDQLYKIASSIKYAGNPRKKYELIDNIMRPRGFIKLSAGTNRVTYRHLEDQSIVMKVAVDKVALKDNPREFINQNLLKPFCTKIFEVSPNGVVALAERVEPVVSREEFLSVADNVFKLLCLLTEKYILADVGSHYFMNYGVRIGFGPVLLDFPYLYEPDPEKLVCHAPADNSTGICGGLIDYDGGFNHLICKKCGVHYRANEIAKLVEDSDCLTIDNSNVYKKGSSKRMKVSFVRNGVKVQNAGDNYGLKDEVKVIKPVRETLKETTVPSVGRLQVHVVRSKSTNSTKEEFRKKSEHKNNNIHVNLKKDKKDYTPKTSQVQITAITFDQLKDCKFKFSSLDLENNLMFFKDKDATISIDITSIPDDEFNVLAEFFGLYKEEVPVAEPVDNSVIEELESLKEKIKDLQDEILEYAVKNDNLNKTIEANNSEIENLNKTIEESAKRISDLSSELNDKNADNDRIIDNNNTLVKIANDREEDLYKANKRIAELELECNNLLEANKEIGELLDDKKPKEGETDEEYLTRKRIEYLDHLAETTDLPETANVKGNFNFLDGKVYNVRELAEYFGLEVPDELPSENIISVSFNGDGNNIGDDFIQDQFGHISCISSINGISLDKISLSTKDDK